MSIIIELEPNLESVLRERAEQEGLPPAQYAEQLVRNGLQEEDQPFSLEEAIEASKRRTPEQIARDRAEILARSRPALPLPPGKTLEDIFNESRAPWASLTDEQVNDALEELS